MSLKIEMLRGFVAVARSGNLNDAADVLKRTPSAVSMMLKQFESHLGEPLFETDRKNKLTPLGEFVFEQAEQEVQHFDNTVRSIQSYASARMGYVRVAAVPSIAGTILPNVMSQNAEAYEHVKIELRDMDSRSILHEMTRGRIDIGIGSLSGNASGLHSRLLLTDRFGVVFKSNNALASSHLPVRWDMLEGVRLLSNSLSEGIRSPEAVALHEASKFSAHNLTSIFALVQAEMGVTILPETAAKALPYDDVVFRPLADPQAVREIHILRRSDAALSPAARQLEADIFRSVTEEAAEA